MGRDVRHRKGSWAQEGQLGGGRAGPLLWPSQDTLYFAAKTSVEQLVLCQAQSGRRHAEQTGARRPGCSPSAHHRLLCSVRGMGAEAACGASSPRTRKRPRGEGVAVWLRAGGQSGPCKPAGGESEDPGGGAAGGGGRVGEAQTQRLDQTRGLKAAEPRGCC